jgi:amidase
VETETPSATALWQLSAQQLASAIRNGEVSSREVVDAHLERIEAVNPSVNAVRVVLADQAREQAGEADRRLATGDSAGPLHGVPISVKENVDVAGTATTWGLAAMAGAISESDAPAVANLRAAGAIPIARGNMPDLALRWHTDNELAGATLNAWDPGRTPGGSSGGEAVSLATGMAPLAVGNDLGGSLRWPSQCAGTCALRPSHGRIPDASTIPPTDAPPTIQYFNSQGPMARHVEDLRVAFDAMISPSSRDPWYAPAPAVGAPSSGPIAVGVAVPEGTDSSVAAGVRRAAAALADADYELSESMPPDVDRAAALWAELLNEDVRRFWPAVAPAASADARRFIEIILGATETLDVEGYAMRWQERQALARRWSVHLGSVPLTLAPIYLQQPFAPGDDIRDLESVGQIVEGLKMVVPVNLLGLPSVAVPVGLDESGLPLAVQIIGPRFREDLLLDAAAAIERAIGTVTPIDPRGKDIPRAVSERRRSPDSSV